MAEFQKNRVDDMTLSHRIELNRKSLDEASERTTNNTLIPTALSSDDTRHACHMWNNEPISLSHKRINKLNGINGCGMHYMVHVLIKKQRGKGITFK